MANPNIVNVSSIYGNTTYLIPTGTTATAWTALTPASGTINKVGTILATNVTGISATVTVSINSATGGGGTAYRIAYQISVPGNSTLIIVSKNTPLYVDETESIVVTSGTSNSIEMVASYEAIS